MLGARVLVIDDSPTILKLVQLVLTKAKFRVTTASSGEAGLVAAKEDPPSLILLDYQLPDINGYDVCGAMSADTVLSRIPVVVMCAATEEIEERFSAVGNVIDYIKKPFSPEALLAVIAHGLEKRDPQNASLPLPAATEPGNDATAETASVSAPATAALTGDLAVISIPDVLSLLADQSQTGVLTVTHGRIRLETFFDQGRIAFATALGVAEEFLLGRFLIELGQITPATLTAVIKERTTATRPPLLGADLVDRGLVAPTGLKKAMSRQTAALVYEGLRWSSGRFWFVPGKDLPDVAHEAAAGLMVDALLMEGFRRVDEWRLIEREIENFDQVFVRNDAKLAVFGRGQLHRDEQSVLEFINGRNTVKDLVYLTNMGSFEVTKMLYRLLRTKLIRRRVGPVAV